MFEVRVAVIFPGAIMVITTYRLVRGKSFQPFLVIRVQFPFVVVYKHAAIMCMAIASTNQ
jgi:hypothetical protein